MVRFSLLRHAICAVSFAGMTESLPATVTAPFPRVTRNMTDVQRVAFWKRMAVGGGRMDKALVERAAGAIYAAQGLPFSGVRYIDSLELSGPADKTGEWLAVGITNDLFGYKLQHTLTINDRISTSTPFARVADQQSDINWLAFSKLMDVNSDFDGELLRGRFGSLVFTHQAMEFVSLADNPDIMGNLSAKRSIRANAFATLLENCWMFSLGDGVLEVHTWPKVVHIDDNLQLHNSEGPALVLANGEELWALRGIEIPPQWRQNLELATPADIVTIEDEALRDVLAEQIGWARIAEALGVTVVEDSGDPIWGRLVDIWLPRTGPKRFLDALCGTGRRFLIPVSNNIRNVNDAQSSLHNGVPFWMLRMAERRT